MIDEKAKPQPEKITLFKKILFASCATFFGLIFLEGAATSVAIVYDLLSQDAPPTVTELSEEKHAEYDEELGWVNTPGVQLEDHYGPGKSITINSQGLRGLVDHTEEDAFRVICLGDSFTLGYGVDDRETFPLLLEEKLPNSAEVVNMGQGGYSVGQDYLWLKRLAPTLKPKLVVCVFIVEDFRRLLTIRTANGFGTPQFDVVGDSVEVSNVPVPPKLPVGEALPVTHTLTETLSRHSTLVRSLGNLVRSEEVDQDEQALYTGVHILLEIQKLCQKMDCGMVVALTPTLPEVFDVSAAVRYQKYENALSIFLSERGIPFRDLSPAFDQSVAKPYFLDEAFHHYSPAGNAVVAQELAEWIAPWIPEQVGDQTR